MVAFLNMSALIGSLDMLTQLSLDNITLSNLNKNDRFKSYSAKKVLSFCGTQHSFTVVGSTAANAKVNRTNALKPGEQSSRGVESSIKLYIDTHPNFSS